MPGCSVLLLVLSLCALQLVCGVGGTFPVTLDTSSLSSSSDSCPTGEAMASFRQNISASIRAILQERVVPTFQCGLGVCDSNPARSCDDVYARNSSSVSGEYWLQRCDGTVFRAYCGMGNPCGCSGSGRTGGWRRVAFLNTTDPSQACPGGTRLFQQSAPFRTCARLTHGCISITYPTDFMQYHRVCGRIIGYQHRSPDAFSPYNADTTKTIDDNYLDGVSVTYGQLPRKHIWSFAVGLDETRSDTNRCPCANTNSPYEGVVPPFIVNEYFCATARRQEVGAEFYPNDPVWDGEGCGPHSTCCHLNNPPWFCKELPEATRDNMELRMCGDEDNENENIPITLIELYIQ